MAPNRKTTCYAIPPVRELKRVQGENGCPLSLFRKSASSLSFFDLVTGVAVEYGSDLLSRTPAVGSQLADVLQPLPLDVRLGAQAKATRPPGCSGALGVQTTHTNSPPISQTTTPHAHLRQGFSHKKAAA